LINSNATNFSPNEAAAFTRPLLLTPTEDLKGYVSGHLGRLILFAITCFSVLAVLLIFGFVAREAIPFITKQGIGELLTSTRWFPEAEGSSAEYGGLALIVGSLYVSVGSLVLSVPLALLAAVFLSDIAPFKVQQVCKPIIEILAAIPSVAYGFFAVIVLAPWMQKHWNFTTGTNALNSSLILAVMAMPTIVSVAQDSISVVGREIREASYSLGATRAETMTKVVIPAAHSGIIAGIILGMMRAVGETMVVWMASGNASQIPHPWWDLSQSIRTMTATIAGELGETPKDTSHYYVLFAVGLLLLIFTFSLNLISEYFLARFRKRKGTA
jgi:phosphate transport system permease protein